MVVPELFYPQNTATLAIFFPAKILNMSLTRFFFGHQVVDFHLKRKLLVGEQIHLSH
jgi:hypothetical protein